ncbi:uncharacterized protein GGS22DRAFT_178767 [Annulohypoxylon maeteangense]|uniref:uncharacterized protein n=1 Tax=Annulohypoxylon maeteangense TaxID=1927788 RepID=UPI002008C4C8|nr:uncharacterized protein GGS22DRAFT_178767 [Annulohypoxylon maeteangense]KAI0886639.1 hypothetical protein GGS22DRAFT_178767 [Annulohypoxylon maeteangense]
MASIQTSECSVCYETKPLTEFRRNPLTRDCSHASTLCLGCVSLSINSQIRDNVIEKISCPECREELGFAEIQKFADKELFSRYHKREIDSLVSKAENFIWCPLGCESGLIHYAGNKQPIVYCPRDNRQFCFRHRIPWHSEHTCDEYDAFLDDPEHFRSQVQIQREVYRVQELDRKRSRQEYEEAEEFWRWLQEEEAAKASQRAHNIRIEQERRRAEERVRLEEEQRKAQEALQHQARLRKEEIESNQTVHRVTRRCPKCRVPIQKNGGW